MTKGDRTKQITGNGEVVRYCQNKRERQNHTFRIDESGKGYYLVNGMELTENEFNSLYPIGLISHSKHGTTRLDSRQNIY